MTRAPKQLIYNYTTTSMEIWAINKYNAMLENQGVLL